MAAFDIHTDGTTLDKPQLPDLAAMTAAQVYADSDGEADCDLVAQHVERTICSLRALPPTQALDDAIAHLVRYAADLAYDAERR